MALETGVDINTDSVTQRISLNDSKICFMLLGAESQKEILLAGLHGNARLSKNLFKAFHQLDLDSNGLLSFNFNNESMSNEQI